METVDQSGNDNDAATDSYIRICFAQDPKRLQTGLDRIGAAITAL